MAYEDSDRRRSVLLGILTVITVPAIYLAVRGDAPTDSLPSDVAGVEAAATGDLGASTNGPNRPPISVSDEDPVFLSGPVADANPGVNEVAIPARPDQPPLEMSASYRSSINGLRTCLVQGFPSGRTVTVTNLDNGRSLTCVTAVAPGTQVADVVLHTRTFSLLADLTEAPITVDVMQ